jgi:hypothetical protein
MHTTAQAVAFEPTEAAAASRASAQNVLWKALISLMEATSGIEPE